AERVAAHEKRASFGKIDASFTIYDAYNALRHAAPQIDRQTIAWADHVIGADGQIHRNSVRIARTVPENVEAETPRLTVLGSRLHIHVVERRDIGIRVSPVDELHWRSAFFQIHRRFSRTGPKTATGTPVRGQDRVIPPGVDGKVVEAAG